MSEPVQTMRPIGPEPVGWETDRERELEQRAFHCNENWAFEDVRQLVNDLWFQYCLAANPIRMEKETGAKDAELAKMREAFEAYRAHIDGFLAEAKREADSNGGTVNSVILGIAGLAKKDFERICGPALNQGASDAP